MPSLAIHYNPPGRFRSIGCLATGGMWTTDLANVTCEACKRLYMDRVVGPIDERRQRAREAFYDTLETTHADSAIDEAIATATRVKLTDDVVDRYGGDRFDPTGAARRMVMREVLAACGFEVEE